MAIKPLQCEFCKYCKEFFAVEQYHLHRRDVTRTKRECLSVDELKQAGWKMSSSKVWSKR